MRSAVRPMKWNVVKVFITVFVMIVGGINEYEVRYRSTNRY